ncbi:MAG: hypothetical protein KDA87_19790 [Planctomycetales bacterium]|nr:hypothetical protein [Planctomycetales bacterium]
MTIHIHRLAGCRPTPLALYLKALGILRIVAEQADPQCRGWWQDEQFCLMTKLSKKEIEAFFLSGYEPTPCISPWNKGAGFFQENDKGLAPIESSVASRFEPLRFAIQQAREPLDEISDADAIIRSIKACTKTNRAFQSPEQRVRWCRERGQRVSYFCLDSNWLGVR